MATRAYWKGQIRLALVSIPVEIYTATRSGAQVSFRQIHEPSGQPIHYEKVVPDIGPIDVDDIVKGYEIAKGEYVLLEQAEIDAVKLESKRTLALTQFVDYDAISVFYFDKPYFVVPADDLADEAFIVLREALRKAGKVGIGQLALRGRESIVTLKPCGRGMVLETLRYADEVNKANSFFRDIPDDKPDPELLELASALIEKKSGDYDPRAFEDHYVEGLHRLIEKKRKAKGKLVLEERGDERASSGKSNVIDLMAALKASVSGKSARAAGKRPSAGAGDGNETVSRDNEHDSDETSRSGKSTRSREKSPAASVGRKRGAKAAEAKKQKPADKQKPVDTAKRKSKAADQSGATATRSTANTRRVATAGRRRA